MHFSIPEAQEIKNGFKTYIAYNIYINGSFHCSLRYRQLYHFHLQLKKVFGADSLHDFPPKKYLPLNATQIEERRSQLERFIQIASQDSQIVNSDIFNGFLLAAQQESHSDVVSSDCIDIYQLDWHPIRLMISGQENSEIVLKKFCQTIKLQTVHMSYFSLYLVDRDVDTNDYNLIRKLQNFESPLLTLKTMKKSISKDSSSNNMDNRGNYVIIIHKSYWNIAFDEDLYDDHVALNIIYLQAVHDIEKGHIITNSDVQKKLSNFKLSGDKLEYLKLARTQQFYGYIHFKPCYCDFISISPKVNVKIFAGNQELIIRIIDSIDEYVFRVIRIKCWRLTTSNHPNYEKNECFKVSNDEEKERGRFELSFEYLVNKDSLTWITIYSTQAVLISYCLQSMVEEMLLKREGKKFRSEGLALRYNTSPSSNLAINHKHTNVTATNGATNVFLNDKHIEWNYFRKDGSYVSLSSTATTTDDHVQTDEKSDPDRAKIFEQMDNSSIKNQLVDSLVPKFQEITLVENGVFDVIGDEDL